MSDQISRKKVQIILQQSDQQGTIKKGLLTLKYLTLLLA